MIEYNKITLDLGEEATKRSGLDLFTFKLFLIIYVRKYHLHRYHNIINDAIIQLQGVAYIYIFSKDLILLPEDNPRPTLPVSISDLNS